MNAERCQETMPDGSRCVLDADHVKYVEKDTLVIEARGIRQWTTYPHQPSSIYTRELEAKAEMADELKRYLVRCVNALYRVGVKSSREEEAEALLARYAAH